MSLPGALRLALLLLTSPTLGHAADAPASPPPKAKTVIGPTGAVGVPLLPGKPIGVAVGVQTIVPVKSWRFAAEVFVASPATAFAPAIGGDVGVGLVDRNGLGGALAVYARHTIAQGEVTPSTQAGPGLLLLSKIAPTVVFTVPFVVWIDAATGAVTPTLSLKVVFGVPYGGR